MTAKEKRSAAARYLSRYKTAKGEVADIERRIEHTRSEMMGVKGISYEGGDMPKVRNVERDLSDYIARIDDLIRDWEAAQQRALETMCEISSIINSIQNDKARRVLMLHFVDNKSYEEIMELIPCGRNSVFRWRRIGLDAVAHSIKI